MRVNIGKVNHKWITELHSYLCNWWQSILPLFLRALLSIRGHCSNISHNTIILNSIVAYLAYLVLHVWSYVWFVNCFNSHCAKSINILFCNFVRTSHGIMGLKNLRFIHFFNSTVLVPRSLRALKDCTTRTASYIRIFL